MMHNDLFHALVESYSTVNWFALGEAFRLAGEIRGIHTDYPKDTDGCQDALVDIAQRTRNFLGVAGTADARKHAEKLSNLLNQIKLGG